MKEAGIVVTEASAIAVVEDDPPIRRLVLKLVADAGFEGIACPDGRELDKVLQRRPVDLVLLDRMLPGEDGLAILQRLRLAWPALPVIMVTARGEDIDRIIGLEVGADDYVAKPFNPRELIARVRALLRRSRTREASASLPPQNYGFEGWVFDLNARELLNPGGERVELTAGEFQLLKTFVLHPQRVLNRDQLMDWTRGRDAGPFDRAIDVQLSRLRRKLGDDPRSPRLLRTIRGGGYVFSPRVERV